MSNSKKTSKKVASKASKALLDSQSSDIQKRLAASALSQSRTNKEPSKEIQELASKVLNSDKYSDKTKEFAGSLLSQSDAAD